MVLAMVAALVVGMAAGGSRSPARHEPLLAHGNFSSNWAGYAAQGGPFTSVSASWVQPAARCGIYESSYSSFWVGLDGSGSPSVEQAGSDADCASGQPVYYGWFEVYPAAPVNYPEAVQPGDGFTAWVTTDGNGAFTIALTDRTQGWNHTEHVNYTGAPLWSAEVVAEAPVDDAGVVPLTNFGMVNFTGAHVNGQTISAYTNNPITMATPSYLKAAPSPLYRGTDFSVTWSHW